VTELLRFECTVEEGGYIKYGTQNFHDDRVIAFALSLWGNQSSNWYFPKIKGYNYNIYNKREKTRSQSGRHYKSRFIKDIY
jgi:hypothetical protein